VSSAGTIEVQWRPDDAGSYRVESGGSDAPGTGNLLREGAVAAEETVVTSINGASLGSAEGSYRVYFYVTDATGRTGSNYTSLRLDNTAPAAPTGFESRVGDRQLFLEWNAGEESDIGGYRVYFGTASGQYDLQGSPVTVSDPDATSYTLKNLENNAVYYLVLTALDEAGNESPPSEEIIAIPEEILGAAGLSGDSENGCFVATVCFGSQYDESVRSLRRLRDEFLRKDFLGRGLIRIYYVLGPRAAEFISDKPTLKWAVRGALLPLVYMEPFLSPQPGPASLLVLFILAGPSIILVLRFSRARRSRRME